MKRLTYFLFAHLLVAACGEDTVEDPGPTGRPNTVQVQRNGGRIGFASTGVSIKTSPTTVVVEVAGNADPIPEAVDDEFSIVLRVGLDRAMLVELETPVSFDVDGRAAFVPIPEVSDRAWTWSGAPAIIESIELERRCFCLEDASGQTRFEGTLTFEAASSEGVAGRFALTATGPIPNDPTIDGVHVIEAEFDRALSVP